MLSLTAGYNWPSYETSLYTRRPSKISEGARLTYLPASEVYEADRNFNRTSKIDIRPRVFSENGMRNAQFAFGRLSELVRS